MNNTKRSLTAITAILLAAALVAGTAGTFVTKTAFASSNNSGNTVTGLAAQNRGFASGFDTTTDQEAQNVICTHPGENAACTQEGAAATPRTCEQCFSTILSLDERTRLLTALSTMWAENPTIAQVCNILEGKDPRNPIPTEAEVREFLSVQVQLKDPTINDLIACLKQAGIVFALTSPPM
jgi:hypothetical protein